MRPDWRLCPPRIVAAFTNYRDHGIPPGGFVSSCLFNNFVRAALSADDTNNELLPHIAAWLFEHMPATCYGSVEIVHQHLDKFAHRGTERDEPRIYNRGELPPPDNRDEHDRTLGPAYE